MSTDQRSKRQEVTAETPGGRTDARQHVSRHYKDIGIPALASAVAMTRKPKTERKVDLSSLPIFAKDDFAA
jgi:hypothetical protein